MKTTINLPDALIKEVKKVTDKKGMTLTSFIEDALRLRLTQEKKEKIKIQPKTFYSKEDSSIDLHWEKIRDQVYPEN